jgi:hypothetical protein
MRRFVSSDVLCAEIQGFRVILDLRTEAYYILDPVANSMWKALVESDDEIAAIKALQQQYSADHARLETDLAAFRQRCLDQRFLLDWPPQTDPASATDARAGGRNLPVLRAWWSMFRTVRSLAKHGLSKTYRELEALPSPAETQDAGSVRRLVAAFATAENFFFMKSAPNDCLPRSLALSAFCAWPECPPNTASGCAVFPFRRTRG